MVAVRINDNWLYFPVRLSDAITLEAQFLGEICLLYDIFEFFLCRKMLPRYGIR